MELDSTEGTSQTSWSIGRRCKRGDAFSRPLLIIREAWPYGPSLFPPTIGCTLGASYWSAGGHSRVEIPVPIPNTEVKRSRADGTAVRPRESRSLPAFFIAYSPLFRVVFFVCITSFYIRIGGLGPLFQWLCGIIESLAINSVSRRIDLGFEFGFDIFSYIVSPVVNPIW